MTDLVNRLYDPTRGEITARGLQRFNSSRTFTGTAPGFLGFGGLIDQPPPGSAIEVSSVVLGITLIATGAAAVLRGFAISLSAETGVTAVARVNAVAARVAFDTAGGGLTPDNSNLIASTPAGSTWNGSFVLHEMRGLIFPAGRILTLFAEWTGAGSQLTITASVHGFGIPQGNLL